MKYVRNLYFKNLLIIEWSLFAFVGHIEFPEFGGILKYQHDVQMKGKKRIPGKHVV